jgi:hypothetical protein
MIPTNRAPAKHGSISRSVSISKRRANRGAELAKLLSATSAPRRALRPEVFRALKKENPALATKIYQRYLQRSFSCRTYKGNIYTTFNDKRHKNMAI